MFVSRYVAIYLVGVRLEIKSLLLELSHWIRGCCNFAGDEVALIEVIVASSDIISLVIVVSHRKREWGKL